MTANQSKSVIAIGPVMVSTTLMKHLLNTCPLYVESANSLSTERAAEICAAYGTDFDGSFIRDFQAANAYAQRRRTSADLRGNGVGLFLSAEHLFIGYVHEEMRVAACEDAEAIRRES